MQPVTAVCNIMDTIKDVKLINSNEGLIFIREDNQIRYVIQEKRLWNLDNRTTDNSILIMFRQLFDGLLTYSEDTELSDINEIDLNPCIITEDQKHYVRLYRRPKY